MGRSRTVDYGDVWVCEDCYVAHHYGATVIDREATDDEVHNWCNGYLRGHDLPNVVEETEHGLIIREWFAGESDTPCDREPLSALLPDIHLSDNTCSNHDAWDNDGTPCTHCGSEEPEDGLADFSWAPCQGCGSTLGGNRSRLHAYMLDV